MVRIPSSNVMLTFFSSIPGRSAVIRKSSLVSETIDENKIDASFYNGVLKVKIPKTPEAKKEVKKILINS